MGLNANEAGGGNIKREPPLDADVYPGRVVQVIDLGLQAQQPYQGQEKPPAQEILLTYEIANEFMHGEDGEELKDRPRWVSESFPLHNLKADRAKSTARYRALDPEGVFDGDFSKLLGAPANIALVVEKGKNKNAGKLYQNVATVSPLSAKKLESLPEIVNKEKIVFFDLDNPDVKVFNALPEWLQKKIKANLNYNGSKLQTLLGDQLQGAAEQVVPNSIDDGSEERPF